MPGRKRESTSRFRQLNGRSDGSRVQYEEDVLKVGLKHMDAEELRELRKSRRESQSTFWKRFGVTQSRGSRFEQGVEIPVTVAILVRLYLDGKISDGDLWRARRGSGALKQINFFNRVG